MANTNGYGDVMRGRRFNQIVMLVLGITFLAYSPLALAAEGTPRVLGTVVATGNASMKAGLDRWVPVDEKTHPVLDGTALKTEEGTTSITMKDGATIEMGKRTDLFIGGTLSNYSMRLQLGTIAFKLYKGTGLFVTTPSTSVVVQQASGAVETSSHPFKDEISGIITHDGKDTQVFCLRGKLSVIQANVETQYLTEGNRVVVESPEAASQGQGAALPASRSSGASSPTVKVYENPVRVPEILEQVKTGGLEVVSEKTP